MDLQLVNLDLVKFKDHPKLTSTKKKKCLECRVELYKERGNAWKNYATQRQ